MNRPTAPIGPPEAAMGLGVDAVGAWPGVTVIFALSGTTWTKVCPRVSVTLLPFRSKNCVLPRNPGFFHVPRIVLPLVEIQALPLPVTWASSRLLLLAAFPRAQPSDNEN